MNAMNEKIYFLLLALMFVLHNIEEYLFYYRMPPAYLKLIEGKFNNPRCFLYAISLLSLLAMFLVLLNYFTSSEIVKTATFIMCLTIFINALQHLVASLWYRKILPGTFTATFLIVPFSIFGWIKLHHLIKIDFYSFMLYLIVSLIVMVLLIHGSLWFGYFLIKLLPKTGDKNE
jgi:hypothetical protein